MTADYLFSIKLADSERSDLAEIIRYLLGADSVVRAHKDLDLRGVDYLAALPGGRVVPVDTKLRTPGCSRHWKGEPDLALEIWSNVENKIVGWTLDAAKLTEYVLFVYAPEDSPNAYMVPFVQLRKAFAENVAQWTAVYRKATQSSDGGQWHSECVFVPASVVLRAVGWCMGTPDLREAA